jgi:hypothetical protein
MIGAPEACIYFLFDCGVNLIVVDGIRVVYLKIVQAEADLEERSRFFLIF